MFMKLAKPKLKFSHPGWSIAGLKWALKGLIYSPARCGVNLIPVAASAWNIGVALAGFLLALTISVVISLVYICTGVMITPVFSQKDAAKIAEFKEHHGVADRRDISQDIGSMDVPDELKEQVREYFAKNLLLNEATEKMLGRGSSPFTLEEASALVERHLEKVNVDYQILCYVIAVKNIILDGKTERLPVNNREHLRAVLEDWLERRTIATQPSGAQWTNLNEIA